VIISDSEVVGGSRHYDIASYMGSLVKIGVQERADDKFGWIKYQDSHLFI
jgi:hypothetical protein